MAIEIIYHKKSSSMDPDFRRTMGTIRGETFSKVLEKLCEEFVIEPQFGMLTEMGSFSPKIPKQYFLIYSALAPHPAMNISFADEQEVRKLFDGLFNPVVQEGDSNYKPIFRVEIVSQTQFSPVFLVNALYYINERSIDEVRRCFDGENNCSKPCNGTWYVFD